jgi:hypothetical protein
MCGGISRELPLEDDDDSVLEFVGDGDGVVTYSFLGSCDDPLFLFFFLLFIQNICININLLKYNKSSQWHDDMSQSQPMVHTP